MLGCMADIYSALNECLAQAEADFDDCTGALGTAREQPLRSSKMPVQTMTGFSNSPAAPDRCLLADDDGGKTTTTCSTRGPSRSNPAITGERGPTGRLDPDQT